MQIERISFFSICLLFLQIGVVNDHFQNNPLYSFYEWQIPITEATLSPAVTCVDGTCSLLNRWNILALQVALASHVCVPTLFSVESNVSQVFRLFHGIALTLNPRENCHGPHVCINLIVILPLPATL